MTIAVGSRLGPYEIVAPIGAGGMGEVWKARDTRLDRSVAIKILPSEFANDAQFKVRFEREAKTISQLTHPHICTLYDVGNEKGVEYLVMELLDGESLADRLLKGPLPIGQVLRYGAEIAEALHVAHRAGVVHRDLKPGNIMLTKNGAKLLDFGLAKPAAAFAPLSGATLMPTEQKPLTREGTIVGTFQYMAPEQLEAQEADTRTDIFALGAVLYEMTTGKRAFDGKTRTSLIASIVSGEPRPIREIQPLTPPAFEHVIRKCLSKDPDDRWQSAHDIAEELRWISEAGSQAGIAAPLAATKRQRDRMKWLVAVVIAAAVAGVASWFAAARSTRQSERSHVYRLTLATPPGSILGYGAGSMALSADGQRITYASYSAEGSALLVRTLSETTWHILNGTSGAFAPFWSPDSRQIGYFARGAVWKVSADGSSAPQEIARTSLFASTGAWTASGVLLVTSGGRLYRVNAGGGEPVAAPLTKEFVISPVVLPDGKHYLFSAITAREQMTYYVASIDGKESAKRIGAGDNTASYADGYFFFVRGGTLYAQPFDAAKLALSGEPEAIAKVQEVSDQNADYSVAGDTLVFLPQGSEVRTELQRADRSGKMLGRIGDPAFFFSPRVSHDGRRIAVDQSATHGPGDIWLLDATSGASTRFSFEPENETAPVWSPADDELIYMMARPRQWGSVLMQKHIAGGQPTLAFDFAGRSLPGGWSPDGKWFLAQTQESADAPVNTTVFSWPEWKRLGAPIAGGAPRFSPDGHWFAYMAESGTRSSEVFVQPFPPNGSRWQVSVNGGWTPVWRPDGRALYFINDSGKVMESAVNVGTDGSFLAQPPQPLFGVALREGTSSFAQYDVFPDGTFLLNRIPDTATTPMTVVVHWKEALGK